MLGFDVGCRHNATVRNSSLGAEALLKLIRIIVNAFHGHAHNRLCQLLFHPLFQQGVGLEDLETCERVFSSSNSVARVIRHASHYHWSQFLDLHFMQWNEDRYADLSKGFFLFFVTDSKFT